MPHAPLCMNKRLLEVRLFPPAVVFTRVASCEIVEENYSVGVTVECKHFHIKWYREAVGRCSSAKWWKGELKFAKFITKK